jgi:hypothetical protein
LIHARSPSSGPVAVYPDTPESTVTRDAYDALLREAERASRLAAEVAALRRLCAVLTAALWLTREELRR